jgi:undecaprenyl phosphate N,N'-diacetylbacillosamine 1-phosphate transferase
MRSKGLYERVFKRLFDVTIALIAIIILMPLLLVIGIIVRIKLGSPVIFKQQRPGLNEKIFTLYKFRTMIDKKNKEGKQLPDSQRLTKFGKFLRSTSLDELPELINILFGDMSFVGPRPQLIDDMFFMTNNERKRHFIRPGLTGLAQISGRNNITWQEKFKFDLEYIENVKFGYDLNILLKTLLKVYKREGVTDGENVTASNLGDDLLKRGLITKNYYLSINKEIQDYIYNLKKV